MVLFSIRRLFASGDGPSPLAVPAFRAESAEEGEAAKVAEAIVTPGWGSRRNFLA